LPGEPLPRELEVVGILFPTLLAPLIASALLFWLLDGALARWGFYQTVWHSPLFRVSLFVFVFCGLGLLVYR